MTASGAKICTQGARQIGGTITAGSIAMTKAFSRIQVVALRIE